jgi:restriction system protein
MPKPDLIIEESDNIIIDHRLPKNWRDLQKQVAQILQECGLHSEIEKDIQTVRGVVNIDVYAEDIGSQPKIIYLIECKHWQSAVPKTIVHAFRTVVADYGANWGFIVSSGGFQSGTFEAAANSNIRLLTWEKFQKLFVMRWIKNFMVPQLYKEIYPLVEYTEPINSRIFNKADKLDDNSHHRFIELRKTFQDLAFLTLPLYAQEPFNMMPRNLPLRNLKPFDTKDGQFALPDEVLDAICLRDLVNLIIREARKGLAEFDKVFGERA